MSWIGSRPEEFFFQRAIRLLLVYVPGTLTVTFADGTQATRYDIGIAPIRFKKDEVTLVMVLHLSPPRVRCEALTASMAGARPNGSSFVIMGTRSPRWRG